MDLIMGAVAMVFGIFIAVSPVRAARIWAAGRLDGLIPKRRAVFLRLYRVFGIVLWLGGLLFAVDSILFPNLPH